MATASSILLGWVGRAATHPVTTRVPVIDGWIEHMKAFPPAKNIDWVAQDSDFRNAELPAAPPDVPRSENQLAGSTPAPSGA